MLTFKNKKHKLDDTTQVTELEDKPALVSTKESNKVITTYIVLSFALLLSILVNFTFIILSLRLATKEKIYVTIGDEVEIAEEKDPYFRSDRVIQETISDFLYLTHEWDSSIPNSSNEDSGVKLEGENSYFKVPTKVYAASYLLEVGFRQQFLEKISQEINPDFYQGRLSSDLKIYHIGKPERFEKNLYRVAVIMTRTEKTSEIETQEVQLNQTIYLQATRPYNLILGDREPSNFRKQLNHLLRNGLIIYEIKPVTF
jgi:hypothetical protein